MCISDWSSDLCSSDLVARLHPIRFPKIHCSALPLCSRRGAICSCLVRLRAKPQPSIFRPPRGAYFSDANAFLPCPYGMGDGKPPLSLCPKLLGAPSGGPTTYRAISSLPCTTVNHS